MGKTVADSGRNRFGDLTDDLLWHVTSFLPGKMPCLQTCLLDARWRDLWRRATSLEFIFKWDMEWCPIFGNLKSLLLNEWFVAIDLLCIPQHSPVLEMLTLQLGNTENLVGATGDQETTRQSVVCVHLKVVNIVCSEVDAGVRKLLNILSVCGILREKISISAPRPCSARFSVEEDSSAAGE